MLIRERFVQQVNMYDLQYSIFLRQNKLEVMDQSSLQQRLPTTLAMSPAYRQKVQDLFRTRDGQAVSSKHLERNIITNPKGFFNLVESNWLVSLKNSDMGQYFKIKTELIDYLKFLIDDFPLNAKFIYEEAFLVVQNHGRLNCVTYLVKDIYSTYSFLEGKPGPNQQAAQTYILACTSVFYSICSVCTLRTSQLKLITNNLTQLYYDQGLSTQVVGQCFRLLDAGLQERTITPYLYFIDNHKHDSLKVLFTNNKWPFTKGMTLFMWINALKSTDCTLLWLKTGDGNQLHVKVRAGKIVVECATKENKDSPVVQVCDFPLNTITAVGIELEPVSQGLFKSTHYELNLSINGKRYKYLTSAIPKFQHFQFVTQYSLLLDFIGCLYSVVICARPELDAFDELCKVSQFGICWESQVWELIDSKTLRNESILCIFNAERQFQGLLLNYVHDKNHACYEGRVSHVKYHKYDSKIVDIYLPFLYFMTLIKDQNEQWTELFDLIMQYILTIVGKEHIQTKSVLLLLFFLEMNNYKISQSTLNLIYETSKQHNNFYVDTLVTYLEVHALVSRGLTTTEIVETCYNPVEKTILLFYLETLWKDNWNWLQGFEGWWSPCFFQSQKNHPYDPKDYLYQPGKQTRVEWSVMNFVTKDYCKCLVEPYFLVPQYADLNRYQQEYVRKECFLEEFRLQLFRQKKGQLLICDKVSTSSLGRLKSKILQFRGSIEEVEESPSKKKGTAQLKEISTECLYIDVLTIVEGVAWVSKEGFIVFSARHKDKSFDHMCVKGFKNERFVYISIPIKDIRKVYLKRFNATNNAVFIKMKDGKEHLLHFYLRNAQTFLSSISSKVKVRRDACSIYREAHQPEDWIDKKMSNYEYLQWLNQIAGRNYSDITQYPVLPWTFITNSLNIEEDLHPFRDLTKNMGLQGDNDRIRYFMEKYTSDNEEELFNQYHFGTHYSSSAIIFNFLIRIRPYAIGALTLQSGKFDVADRIFYSYWGSWNNAITSPTDLRELIPEIYTLPQMFINQNNYQYGKTQDKIVVDNVLLPSWAHQNPYRFVAQLRRQLQSKYVSENINNWIDLIYGRKQRGKDAIEHMNIFYPLTYQNCIDLSKVTDPEEKESFETQIAHFGQNPAQVIGNNPHPKRLAIKAAWEDKLVPDGNDLTIHKCFLSKAPLHEDKFLFNSVFEGRNSILGIRFIGDDFFFVLRKNQYYLFQLLREKGNFLSKELEMNYDLQSIKTTINYKELSTFMPMVVIGQKKEATEVMVLVGGFYNGNTQLIFLKDSKYNRSYRFPTSTITAMAYHQKYNYLYLGDVEGYLHVYKVSDLPHQIHFQAVRVVKAHDSKINDMNISYNANLICMGSEDGSMSILNAYSLDIVRTIRHPSGLAIHLAHLATNPLYAVVFYSKDNSTLYVYSINGQLLDSFTEKTGFVYNMNVLRSTDSTERLVYLNGQRELFIWELPFLKLKRKVKVKKDQARISCFQACSNSKIVVAGTEDGALQLITHPQSS